MQSVSLARDQTMQKQADRQQSLDGIGSQMMGPEYKTAQGTIALFLNCFLQEIN